MTERPNRTQPVRQSPLTFKNNPAQYHRPFWLPASNYYILSAAAAIAVFFLIWGVLHDGDEPTPWIPAGVSASMVLVGAVFLREIVLRKARNRYLSVQRRLDYNLDNVSLHTRTRAPEKKLTLEKNAEIVRQIQKKSDAARVLMKLSDGHQEVAEICREYLDINRRELENAGAGSPRLAGLLRSRDLVRGLHKFHLLAWAELESRELTREARHRPTTNERTETAQKALDVLQTALKHYPDEPRLNESAAAVREFVTSIRVGHYLEQAERSAFKGNYKRAVSHYKDALFFLAREGGANRESELLADKINREIDKILEIPTNVKNLNSENEQ